jgi:D-arginine dehydrogenase
LVFDFVVIGAGMAGASIADALAPVSRVALLESEPHPGYHSTARSAALFAPSYGSPTFTALARASHGFLSAPPSSFFPTPVLHPRGALAIARTDQLTRLHAKLDAMRRSGANIELLSAEAARSLVPSLRAEYLAAAAHESDTRDIDVEVLFRGFLKRGKAAGVQLVTQARLGKPQRRQDTWHVPVGADEISGHVIVNAAGAWADEVATRFGAAPLGLQVLRRSAAIIDPPTGMAVGAWPAVFDIDEQFYLKPDAGRLLVSPEDEEPAVPGDAYPEDLAIAVAIDRIQTALDIDVARVRRSWAGLRTFAPDRNPLIGYDRSVPAFFWCAGHGGYGIQTAPAFSALAAALACGEPIPEQIRAQGVTEDAVTPRRFG